MLIINKLLLIILI